MLHAKRRGAGPSYREIDVDAIVPNPQQPRTAFDEEALAELEHSIREFGLLQPVVVREAGPGGYQLVMGERRWRAPSGPGSTRIPAIVRQTGDDALLRDALLENIHRVQLNPLEEAAAYEQLLVEFGVTHTELADRLGRSRPVVTNTIRLLKLPVAVQRRVAAGVLSAGHARALLGLEDAGQQEDLAGADRRGGAVGARDRGGRARWRAGTSPPTARAATPEADRRRPDCTSWPSACPTRSTPGSGWSWVSARAGSSWSSARSRTWSGSPADGWRARLNRAVERQRAGVPRGTPALFT